MASATRRAKVGEVQKYFNEVVLTYEGDECLIWPFALANKGYAQMRYLGEVRQVHAILCEIENGPRPSLDMNASHSCGKGTSACVNRHHVRWLTKQENEREKVAHGNHYRGPRHHWYKDGKYSVA